MMEFSSQENNDTSPSNKRVVIAGAGVIGTSTAYYLQQQLNHDNNRISSITLVDPTGTIAPAASGKAGGFLALDWNDYAPTGSLARRSFALHEELASKLGGSDDDNDNNKIMYRRLTCASISVLEEGKRQQRRPGGKKLEGVEWADDVMENKNGSEDNTTSDDDLICDGTDIIGYRPLGDESTIAQVHPKLLCDALWESVEDDDTLDSSLVKGEVVGAVYDAEEEDEKNNGRKLVGAKLEDGSIIDADVILFACGPWTSYGNCMLGIKYHSAIIPTTRVLNQSVFFDGFGDPEVYPRPDKTAYCTGFPDPAVRVAERPGKEEVRDDAIDKIVENVRKASGGTQGALGKDPELKQSCYLPTTPDGLPMMGEISGQKGCFVAAGHGCWGILMGPATGEAMASLMMTGSSTKYVDLSPFSPSRFS